MGNISVSCPKKGYYAEHQIHPSAIIDADEERIIHGALSFSERKVSDVMTPISVTVYFYPNDTLGDETLKLLRDSGRSRFPVIDVEADKVVGVLYVKDLVGKIFDGVTTVASVARTPAMTVLPAETLDGVLNRFLESRSHLFVVQDEFGVIHGIITAEDVIEEILKKEIMDESDRVIDMRQAARERMEKK
jgi:metal transporter CNNM